MHHQAAAAATTPSSTAAAPSPSGASTPAEAARDGPPPLPAGWGELRTGDGRPYYVYYPSGAVQWERPKSPVDPEGGDKQEQTSPEGEQHPAAVAAAGDEAMGGGGGGAGVDECVEDDVVRGEVSAVWSAARGGWFVCRVEFVLLVYF